MPGDFHFPNGDYSLEKDLSIDVHRFRPELDTDLRAIATDNEVALISKNLEKTKSHMEMLRLYDEKLCQSNSPSVKG